MVILSKSQCTACTACYSICPKNAITMLEDGDGFKHPVIDDQKCINCGLCKKVCPVLNNKNNSSLNDCFVAYNNNQDDRVKSSSGGIFSLVARNILKENGVVIGAAFDEKLILKHVAIEKEEDLDKLRGSKYLQSDLGEIFKHIKDTVSNRKVLFVGTPCQVAGLKAFLKEDSSNLICIDFVCHGVPSPKLFKKYQKELEEKHQDRVVDYNFRDKVSGWDSYSNTVSFENSKITQLHGENEYMKLFLADVALRESCYDCKFKLGNKYSDITLGDFWGVKKYYPDFYGAKGTSAVIINTTKGKDAFESIKDNLTYKECKLSEIVEGNPSLKVSSKAYKNRELFFNELDNNRISELAKKYSRKKSLIRKLEKKGVRFCKKVVKIILPPKP